MKRLALALAALGLAAASCGALGWALEPAAIAQPLPATPLPDAQVEPEPAQAACRCLDQPPPPPPTPTVHTPTEGPQGTGAAATIGAVATVVGLLTGNPVAWNLLGTVASHLIGAVGATRRRKANP